MPEIVTLTTDFGSGSTYVAAMKGSLLAVAPHAKIIDLSHDLPPQDLMATAIYLQQTLRWFPTGTIHVVVVDPGVGTDRAVLLALVKGQFVLAPDNGCWTTFGATPDAVWRLNRPIYWQAAVSPTFHGRDIFAPVAGHLCRGVAPDDLGSRVTEWVKWRLPEPRRGNDCIIGEVIDVDHFGNLITNVASAVWEAAGWQHLEVAIGDATIRRMVQTYGDASKGELIALVSSGGRLEIAVVNGSAAARLGTGRGAAVEIRRGLVS